MKKETRKLTDEMIEDFKNMDYTLEEVLIKHRTTLYQLRYEWYDEEDL